MNLLQTIVQRTAQGMTNQLAQPKRKEVVQRVLAAVAERHPDWDGMGLDDHFIAHQGAALMKDYFAKGQLPDAAAIAAVWSNQYKWFSMTKQEAQSRFMPVAQDFVRSLEAESVQAKLRSVESSLQGSLPVELMATSR